MIEQAGHMDEVSLFDAITILVSVSVFSTGFLSVRTHAKRDRLLGRVERISEILRVPSASQGDDYNYGTSLLMEEFEGYREANNPDTIAVVTALGNFGIFLLVVILSALIIASKNWRFTAKPSEVAYEFWALMVIAVVELGIAYLGFKDLRSVYRDITNRLNRSFAMKLNNAVTATELRRFDRAISYYDEMVDSWPATHLSYFLRGKAYLDMGDDPALRENADSYYIKAHDDFVASSKRFASSTIYRFASVASIKAKRYDWALSEATKAIGLDQANARAYLLRGDAYKAIGKDNEAEKDYEQAKQLDPSAVDSWTGRALISNQPPTSKETDMSKTLLKDEELKDVAIGLPVKGLSVAISKLDAGSHPIHAVGETLHTPNLVIYNFFAKGIVSALGLPSNVGGIILKEQEVWYLAFNEGEETISFACQEDENYAFTIQLEDPQTGLVSLRGHQNSEALELSHLEDFECNDKPKLRFLYRALHAKYQEDLISVNCLIPYDEEIPVTTLGRCDWACLWNFQCRGSLVCNSCRWFKKFTCG